MITRDVSPNRPIAPQFPPGSPFEDFSRLLREKRSSRNILLLDKEEMKQLLDQVLLLTKKDLIVTNNHVIANSSSITVVLHDGTSLQAKLIGSDKKTDLAILKLKLNLN